MGKCRARQQTLMDGNYNEEGGNSKGGDKVTNILIHGDAAFTGQGFIWCVFKLFIAIKIILSKN